MTIEVASNFRINEVGASRLKEHVFRQRYSQFIYLTVVHNLSHLFAPSNLFNRGYERSERIQDIVESLELVDPNPSLLYVVEDLIRKGLRNAISNDGHQYYGMYDVGAFITSRGKSYLLKCRGDYRIMEWEEGRGKETPLEPTLDEVTIVNDAWEEINKSISRKGC